MKPCIPLPMKMWRPRPVVKISPLCPENHNFTPLNWQAINNFCCRLAGGCHHGSAKLCNFHHHVSRRFLLRERGGRFPRNCPSRRTFRLNFLAFFGIRRPSIFVLEKKFALPFFSTWQLRHFFWSFSQTNGDESGRRGWRVQKTFLIFHILS